VIIFSFSDVPFSIDITLLAWIATRIWSLSSGFFAGFEVLGSWTASPLQHRRDDHEDDQEHEHDVDERRDVDVRLDVGAAGIKLHGSHRASS
jgi:hypothetical protein